MVRSAPRRRRRWPRSRVHLSPRLVRFYFDLRGRYRIFNDPEYRFYRSSTSTPPAEGDTPYATSATLPDEPTDTFADGTWLISVSYFNGVIDSGFLPIGPNGETYRRMDIDTGAVIGSPPIAPLSVELQLRPDGVVRVAGVYVESGDGKADEWAINYTTNGSTPDPDDPGVTVEMTTNNLNVLGYDLPAQSHGTTVKVRVQVRRNDGDDETPIWVYSEGSAVLTITADAQGPDAIEGADGYPGPLPEDF